ncbi:alpha/beta fold hydrolase [Pseudooceanicola sp. LIPI14-2-Ac024]|uniref:alpha/beta fold hydrolase n=1 Tax=Pseudooceanicola sp. LIPI14-2-Ac024 TaxID=3344875 RepID=UPI0035CF261D
MTDLLRRLLTLCALTLLAACSALPTAQDADVMPIVHDGKAHPGMKRAVVVIPGAMASVGMYEPVLDWNVGDGSVMAYRFPGLDGLKLDHRLDISRAGELIAEAMDRLEVKEVYLIGFSTGGPVAIEAARHLQSQQVSVALVSSAGPFPSGINASIDGFFDVLTALIRAHGSSMEDAWLENYRTLLYGRKHFGDRKEAEHSKELAEQQRGNLLTPGPRMTMAHTADLMTWTLPRKDPALAHARIAFFHGEEDTVFPLAETQRFAARIGAEGIKVYPGQGHILFVTAPTLWDDIRRYFGLPG